MSSSRRLLIGTLKREKKFVGVFYRYSISHYLPRCPDFITPCLDDPNLFNGQAVELIKQMRSLPIWRSFNDV